MLQSTPTSRRLPAPSRKTNPAPITLYFFLNHYQPDENDRPIQSSHPDITRQGPTWRN